MLGAAITADGRAKNSARVTLGRNPDDIAPVLSRACGSTGAFVGENASDKLHRLYPTATLKGNSTTAQNPREIIQGHGSPLPAPSFSPYHPRRGHTPTYQSAQTCRHAFAPSRRHAVTPIRRYTDSRQLRRMKTTVDLQRQSVQHPGAIAQQKADHRCDIVTLGKTI
jgi:hypothetical protein